MAVPRPDGSQANALEAVMASFLETGVQELYGAYASNLGMSCLLKLVEARAHPGLAAVVVKGRELVVAGTGVRTRSQAAKSGGPKYTEVRGRGRGGVLWGRACWSCRCMRCG
jgi:hypothetical protein